MPAGYGAVSLELPTPRGARSVNKPAVAVSALLAVCGAALHGCIVPIPFTNNLWMNL
jgi:hypothetical protein